MTDPENEAYFSARYAEARILFPLLGFPTFTHNEAATITTEELNVGGLAVFNLPPGFNVQANDTTNHVCKHEAGHAYLRRLERTTGIPRATYIEQFRVKFGYPIGYEVTNYGPGYSSLEEAWAETFCNACEGRVVTSKSYLDEQVDPRAARVWFQSLNPANLPTPPKEPALPTIEQVGPAADPNYLTGRSGNPISLIIDHWVGAGTLEQAIAHFKSFTAGTSAHYIVGTTGRIVQVVQDEDTAYHAGDWQTNQLSIGIEHEATPLLAPTDALYEASAWLHRYLADRHGLDLIVGTTVKRHRDIIPTQCPGTLDVERIVSMAVEYVTKTEFQQYQADVAATLNAMKAQYDPLVPKSHNHAPNVVVTLAGGKT